MATKRAVVEYGAALALVGVIAATPTLAARQQPARPSYAPIRCLDLNRIDHVGFVDDESMLYYTKDRTIYRVELARACPGLHHEKRIMYRLSMGRLCSNDSVTVLEDTGFGFVPGATCRLGTIAPITAEEASALLPPRHTARSR